MLQKTLTSASADELIIEVLCNAADCPFVVIDASPTEDGVHTFKRCHVHRTYLRGRRITAKLQQPQVAS
eukprot:m.242589 g.242589  ORF g.242589 m.242589 type:complete len:69 (-) comp19009_c1_seq1:136-342(-)